MSDPIRAAIERLKPFIPKPSTPKSILKQLTGEKRDLILNALDAITNGTAILTSEYGAIFECSEPIADNDVIDLLIDILRTHGAPGVKSICFMALPPDTECAICIRF